MRRITIVILIDALGCEIAARHGFHPAALPAKGRLRTVLGFSQAALGTIFTGLNPDGHGLWMMYSFTEKQSPFAWLALVPRTISARRLWLRRLIQWNLVHASGVRGYYSLYDVPRELFPFLDIPARGDIFGPRGAGRVPTVIDRLDEEKVPRLVWDYRTPETRAFDELQEAIRAGRAEFYLLYTAALDSDLHRYGTAATQIGEHLAWYSGRIEGIAGVATALAPDANIVVLGDHGMCDVRGSMDVMRRVEALRLDMKRDCVPFYDSTMARFKVRSSRARDELERLLRDEPSGRILTPDEMRDLGVAFPDGRFGDLIFLADPGMIILPSYMGSEGVAAMHGYHPDTEGMYSAVFSNRALPRTEMMLSDVAGLICPGFEPARRRDAS